MVKAFYIRTFTEHCLEWQKYVVITSVSFNSRPTECVRVRPCRWTFRRKSRVGSSLPTQRCRQCVCRSPRLPGSGAITAFLPAITVFSGMLMRGGFSFTGSSGFAWPKPHWRGTSPAEGGIEGLGWEILGFQYKPILLWPSSHGATSVDQRSWSPDFWPLETLLRVSFLSWEEEEKFIC